MRKKKYTGNNRIMHVFFLQKWFGAIYQNVSALTSYLDRINYRERNKNRVPILMAFIDKMYPDNSTWISL